MAGITRFFVTAAIFSLLLTPQKQEVERPAVSVPPGTAASDEDVQAKAARVSVQTPDERSSSRRSLSSVKHAARPAAASSRSEETSTLPVAVQGAPSILCQITAYGPGFDSTGKRPGDPAYGITASGTRATEGKTVAVDPSLIPIGSTVYIEGIGYRVAEDVGGAVRGHHIDVFFDDDTQALRFGVHRGVRVYLLDAHKKL